MCGIFGVFDHKDAANMTYLGLHALQHRGQESAGIASTDDYTMNSHREMGLVSDIFHEDVLSKLEGTAAIGHVRYSTAGSSNLGNAQPLVVEYAKGNLAIAHNGNLTNAGLSKRNSRITVPYSSLLLTQRLLSISLPSPMKTQP